MIDRLDDIIAKYELEPLHNVHPGQVIDDVLVALGWTQTTLAGRSGMATGHLNRIIREHRDVTVEVAIKIERATGITGLGLVLVRAMADHAYAREVAAGRSTTIPFSGT